MDFGKYTDKVGDVFADFMPSVSELMIFATFVIFVIIIAFLLHYQSINKTISKESRCLRERLKNNSSGVYTVRGTSDDNEALYKVSYDLKNKTSTLDCDCSAGTVQNHFTKIPVYDIKKNITRYTTKNCACDKNYDEYFGEKPNKSVYFDGYPSLIRYMQNQDTGFFFVDESPQASY